MFSSVMAWRYDAPMVRPREFALGVQLEYAALYRKVNPMSLISNLVKYQVPNALCAITAAQGPLWPSGQDDGT